MEPLSSYERFIEVLTMIIYDEINKKPSHGPQGFEENNSCKDIETNGNQ